LKVKIKNLTIKNNTEVKSLLTLITDTGKECILHSAMDKNKIGVLINTGLYKEDHCMEPAYASLIQESLKINSSLTETHSLSFDLMNGNNGIFSAIQVAQSLMQTQPIEYAMITGFDLGKTPKEHLSAVMILENDLSDIKGFGEIQFKSYTDYQEFDRTYLDLDDKRLVQYKHYKLDDLMLDLFKDVFNSCLKESKKTIDEYKYLILPYVKIEQQKSFIKYFNINPKTNIIFQDAAERYSQTIGPFTILNKLMNDKCLQEKDKVYMIQSGAGLTIGCSEYQF
jgi:3-oxoacyl-[acyl-carrier-protein] synthase III